MNYKPPKTIWEVEKELKFDLPLEATDPRFVDTRQARGEFSFDSLLKPLGVDKDQLRFKPERVYTVFCGHRGCGKSTELRRLKSLLHAPERFFVVFLDTLVELDINNLQYSDILMALAKKLFDELEDASIPINQVLLGKLHGWFAERNET